MSGDVILQRAETALQHALAVATEPREPGNPAPKPASDKRQGRRHEPVARAGSLFLLGHRGFVRQLLVPRARELEVDETACVNRVAFGQLHLIPIDEAGTDVEGFVLTGVGEPDRSRPYPIVVPADVVALELQGCGSLTDRVRLLTELVGLYSDAVCLSSELVSVRGELVRSVSVLAGLLDDAVRLCCVRLGLRGDRVGLSREPVGALGGDAPTVEASGPERAGTGVEGAVTPAPSTPHPIVAAVINNRDVLEDAAVDYRGGTEIRAALDLLVRLADAAKATGVPGVGLAASTPDRVITDDGDPRPIGTLAEVLAWQRIAAWAEAHRALIAAAPGLFGGLLELVEQAERATDERIKASS